jgi:hypothetical protein
MFPRKSQFPPISASQNGRFTKNNNQYAIYCRTITTVNTKTTNNKENIHEFNFKAAKTRSFLTSDLKCHLRTILGDKNLR